MRSQEQSNGTARSVDDLERARVGLSPKRRSDSHRGVPTLWHDARVGVDVSVLWRKRHRRISDSVTTARDRRAIGVTGESPRADGNSVGVDRIPAAVEHREPFVAARLEPVEEAFGPLEFVSLRGVDRRIVEIPADELEARGADVVGEKRRAVAVGEAADVSDRAARRGLRRREDVRTVAIGDDVANRREIITVAVDRDRNASGL